MDINLGEFSNFAALAVIAGFLWNLHRDMSSLRDRISKLEGTVDMLAKFLIDREHGKA